MPDNFGIGNYRSILDETMELVLYIDKYGNVSYANNVAMKLLDYKQIEGVNVSNILPNLFKKNGDELIIEMPIGGEVVQSVAYRENNTCFSVDVKLLTSRFINDQYVCLMIDTSKLESLEKQLAGIRENAVDVDMVKTEFVANVTHELRTPVNGILGNTRELLSREPGIEEAKILSMIERGCEDMHALINNILDFSKLDAGKFQLEAREFNFRNMIEYVKSNHVNKIHEKGLDFFITVSPDIPEVLIGDELRVVQILNNLLSNATKFTTVGKIMMEAVITAHTGNRVELFFMVMDTGIGIDKKNQDKLFKSFSQVEASISRRFGGTGLGLNISKQLVELMGGHIDVESELGKGTTFTFSIWLDVPEGESVNAITTANSDAPVFSSAEDEAAREATQRAFGSEENLAEIDKRLMKLALCIDMETWEKAEMFTDAIKQLSDGAPREVSTAVLRLKMAVQKENGEKATAAIEQLRSLLN